MKYLNILWIVGNGFDLNLGLKTGYQHFLQGTYLKADSKEYKYRDELLKRIKDNPLFESDNWSDLEKLLGEATLCYDDDKELFHLTFEEMGKAFVGHVSNESEVFLSRDIPNEWVSELHDSIANFPDRISELDRQKFGKYKNDKSNITYQFASLNYTETLEVMLKLVNARQTPFDSRYLSGITYNDKTAKVFHPHGTISNDEMVFGVSDESQLRSELFHDDESEELWIKKNINSYFGNMNSHYLHRCIAGASQIFIFGVSLGESDKYIWEQLGKWLTNNSSHMLVFFSHDFPPKGSFNKRSCQKARLTALEQIRESFGITPDEHEEVKDRVLILPSETVFMFNMDNKNDSKR